MKHLTRLVTFKMFVTLLFFNFIQLVVLAQESTGGESSSTTSTSKTKISVTDSQDWYTSPWVWVIGGAIFILLLVALLRGNSSRTTDTGRTDRVTVTKTVRSETDTDGV